MRRDNPVEPRLKHAAVVVAVCAAVVLLYLIFMVGQFRGLTDVNALDYAQIGRNLARGKGFTTSFIKPLSLARVKNISHHPDLTYPPLHPALLAVFLRFAGDSPAAMDRAVALGSGLPFLLTAIAIFFLARPLFDGRTAWLSVAMYATSRAFLGLAISGLEVCLLSLLVTVLLLALYGFATTQRHRLRLAAVVGLLLGLLYLTKYIWIVVLVPVLVYMWFASEKSQRGRALGVTLAVLAVVMLPWCVRMYHVTGNPLFSFRWQEIMMQTRTNPGNTLYRSYAEQVQSPVSFIAAHPVEMYDKIRSGVGTMYGALLNSGPYLVAFFIVAIMVPLGLGAFERLRYLIYAMFLCVFIALTVVLASPYLLQPIAPVVMVIGCGFFYRMLSQRVEHLGPKETHRWTVFAVAMLVLLGALPTAMTVAYPQGAGEDETVGNLRQWCREVAAATDGPVVTDIPWLISWYGQREAIWLPKGMNDLQMMERDFGRFKWLLLTPTVSNLQASERTGEWVTPWQLGARMDVGFGGFVVQQRMANGSWVLFRRASGLPGASPAS